MALSKQLQYPSNIASGNNDYFRIGIFAYEPNTTLSGQLGGGRGPFQVNGSKSTRNLKSSMGNIILPMPNNISDSNSVQWNDDSLNSIQIAGFGAAEAAIGSLSTEKDVGENINSLKKVVEDRLKGGLNALQDPTIADALKKALVGEAVNVFGGNIDTQSLISRTSGQVLNPNLELLFRGVILREFNYSFTLTPRDSSEAAQIKGIINLLKRSMAAKSTASNGAGKGAFIKAPDVFQPIFMQGPRPHPFLYTIKQSALVGMSVNYVGTGAYATYNDGTPVKMEMQLRFKELSPVYNEDYDQSDSNGVGF